MQFPVDIEIYVAEYGFPDSLHKPNFSADSFCSVFLLFLRAKFLCMNFPANLKYTKDHEWILVEGDTATVGITEFAQHELGDIVFVDISSVGKTFAANEIFGTVEAVKTVSDLYLPVGGTIEEVNPGLDGNPEQVNSDPYGKGWMIKMKVSNPAEVEELMDADAYKALVGE